MRDGVRRLERRQDPFEPRERLEAVERFGVGDVGVLGAAELAQPRVLGPDRRVVEAGGDRVRQLDVARLVLQHERARALQHARCCRRQTARRDGPARSARRPPRRRSAARRGSSMKPSKMPIALLPPPTQATTMSGSRPDLLEHLAPRLAADDRLELADHQRIRMRAERRARAGSRCRATLATQSRIASLMASFSVLLPASTWRTVAPSSCMRTTFSAWRRMSSAPM